MLLDALSERGVLTELTNVTVLFEDVGGANV